MKNVLHKILVSLFLFSCVLTSFAYDFEVDGICYNVLSLEDLTCEVTRDNNKRYTGEIVIPSSVTISDRTFSVIKIGSSAFYNCPGITSVIIPNSITEIESSVFAYCI